MRYLVLCIALAISLGWSGSAFAGDALLSWDPPTQYEDGTALPLSEISYYKIYYGNSSGGPYASSITVPGTATTATISNLAKGMWYFVATTVATNGMESALSTEGSKEVKSNARPKPPRWRSIQ